MLRAVVSRETYHRKEPYAGRIRVIPEHLLTLECGHVIRVRRWDGGIVREVECPRCETAGAAA